MLEKHMQKKTLIFLQFANVVETYFSRICTFSIYVSILSSPNVIKAMQFTCKIVKERVISFISKEYVRPSVNMLQLWNIWIHTKNLIFMNKFRILFNSHNYKSIPIYIFVCAKCPFFTKKICIQGITCLVFVWFFFNRKPKNESFTKVISLRIFVNFSCI